MRALPVFLLLLLSLSTLTNGSSIDFDLVHRDSPLSPLYNSSSTRAELAERARLRSLIRSKRLLLQTDVHPTSVSDGEYLIRIYIGSPPIEAWVIADTGSDLIFVQCLPCDTCYPHTAPVFNPFKSSTYRIVSCHSKPCTFFPKGSSTCGNSTQCSYNYTYGDSSATIGELARDFFTLSGKSTSFHKSLLFGCGHNNTGTWPRISSGLVGLGTGPLSLVSQLGPKVGHKLSYCLVPYFSNSTSKLKLGKEAKISELYGVVSTPFITGGFANSNYVLTLEGITVGNKRVETSTSPKGQWNTIIDSGTEWFIAESSFYKKIEALVKEAIGIEEAKNPPEPYSLCYSTKHAETIMKKFPDFVVHFKGADLNLKPDPNIFFPLEDLLCFVIVPQAGFIYGNVVQVNFQVEYDLEAKKIYFAPTDCGKM